jgi:hypothetical protein
MRILFWVPWITITAAAVIYVTWALWRSAPPIRIERANYPNKTVLIQRPAGGAAVVAALALLGVFLTLYVAINLIGEDFDYYDNELFLLTTLKGHFLPLRAGFGGRFFPLAFQEFNLAGYFTDSVAGYHALPILQLFAFCSILLVLDSELSISARAGLTIASLLTPSIFISFGSLEAPERNILFFLVIFVLSIKLFEQTKSIPWAVSAVVCAQFMIYYKETGFLLLLGFAATRLFLRCRNGDHAGLSYKRLWDTESRLDLCLAALALLFVLHYIAVVGLDVNADYAAEHRQPVAEIELAYLKCDPLAFLLVGVAVARIWLIVRERTAPWPLWDGLAFGGVACFLGYQTLRMFSSYYLAPVDLIAVLYVGRTAVLSWGKMRRWSQLTVAVLAFAVLVQGASVSTFAAFERKNVIRAKAEIASLVLTRSRLGGPNSLTLVFPFSHPYVIMEFGAYLNYRGVPLEGFEKEAFGSTDVLLAAGAVPDDGPCVSWTPVRCHAESVPATGDLIIVLPDDEVSLEQAREYRDRGELTFSYQPRPAILHWLYSFIGSVPIATPRFTHGSLPDRWMDASVTIWK